MRRPTLVNRDCQVLDEARLAILTTGWLFWIASSITVSGVITRSNSGLPAAIASMQLAVDRQMS